VQKNAELKLLAIKVKNYQSNMGLYHTTAILVGNKSLPGKPGTEKLYFLASERLTFE
jgi:hypothetical protein